MAILVDTLTDAPTNVKEGVSSTLIHFDLATKARKAKSLAVKKPEVVLEETLDNGAYVMYVDEAFATALKEAIWDGGP